MEKLKLRLLRPDSKIPTRSTSGSVGYDIMACIEEPVELLPGETVLIGAGFSIELEQGCAAFIYARSGLGVKHGIIPANCVGVIDSDYRGEIMVGLKNTSSSAFTVNDGDRIAQMVITRCELPDLELCGSLGETLRGSHGFGSSGIGG